MATDDKIDSGIKSLASQALEAGAKGAFFKLVIVLVVTAGIIWMRYRVWAKAQELAEARTQIDHARIDAEREKVFAKIAESDMKKAAHKREHDRLKLEIAANEAALAEAKRKHDEQVAKIQKLRNWEDLEKLAGIE